MEKTLEQAAKEFNRFSGNVGHAAAVFEGSIKVFYNHFDTGLSFQDVATFEQWAYEGGDSV